MSSARTSRNRNTTTPAWLTTVFNWGVARQERARAWLDTRSRTSPVAAPRTAPASHGVASLVILNWKRPDNVRLILDAYIGYACIDDVIVWNNNVEERFEYRHPKVRCINSDEFGLNTRWLGCLLARHDSVVVHDDDLLCDEATVALLVASHANEPMRSYGIHGRNPTPANEYADKVDHVKAPTECDVHLTRVACVNRRLVPRYFDALAEMDLEIDPARGGGEDIVCSYAIRAATGRRPLIVPGEYVDLTARHALANRHGSQASDRTRIMRACQRWLEQERVDHAC